jgi:hypothetical protein
MLDRMPSLKRWHAAMPHYGLGMMAMIVVGTLPPILDDAKSVPKSAKPSR